MSVANAKKERSVAVVALDTKIVNLESLSATSKGAELDNAWYAVKEELKTIEDKHNRFKLAVMSDNNDEVPNTGADSGENMKKWYTDQIARVRAAEKTYKAMRYVDVEKQLDEARKSVAAEADVVEKKKLDGIEAVDAAVVLMEKAYSILKPLINLAATVVPVDKDNEMQDKVKSTMARYHEAKRIQSEARADFEMKIRTERERREMATAAAEVAGAAAGTTAIPTGGGSRNTIKFKPLDNPVFSGDIRDYYRWKEDFEEVMLPRLASAGESEKLMTLKACLTTDVKREVSSTCTTQAELFKELDQSFGNKEKIISTILKEVKGVPKPLDHEYRKQVTLIRSVQKAVKDLTDLKSEYEIKNQTILDELENKLSPKSFERWNLILHDPASPVKRIDRFDKFMGFLKVELELAEYASKDTPVKKKEERKANTRSTRRMEEGESDDTGCRVCESSSNHAIYNCPDFKKMKPREREQKVRELRLCFRCLKGGHSFSGCDEKTKVCTKCSRNHNVLLHFDGGKPGYEKKGSDKFSKEKLDEICRLQKLLEEAFKTGDTEKIKQAQESMTKVATTHATATTLKTSTEKGSGLLDREGVKEKPVIMMIQYVTTSSGKKVGTIWDGASDTNYITFRLAKELRLVGEPCKLAIRGVAGMTKELDTQRYVLKLKSSRGGVVKLVVYGLEHVADVTRKADVGILGKIFPDQPTRTLERPEEIELMISQHNAGLMPSKKEVSDDLVLWQGALGVVVSGAHEDLRECVTTYFTQSETHLAFSMVSVKDESVEQVNDKMELLEATADITADVIPKCVRCLHVNAKDLKDMIAWFKYDQIGAACEPKCGGCRCSGCGPGGAEMSLKDQREMKKMEECLTFVPEGDEHKATPHWHASYSYVVSPENLPNNYGSVRGMFLSTERRLDLNPVWKSCYADKIHDMINRKAAVKLTPAMKAAWKGPVWYVNHLIALNPNSHTSPIRLVWNSSQNYQGVSLNSCLLKGPDVLNGLGGVLLRFRSGTHAIIGDLVKMYNSVYLEMLECNLHRFLWRDSVEDEIEEYCIVVVNIGDKPAGCLAMMAVKNTASLPEFKDKKEAVESILKSMYVDDLLDSYESEELRDAAARDCDLILEKGGFGRKPWILSGSQAKGMLNLPGQVEATELLPNQIPAEETRALGMRYDVEADELFIAPPVNFSKRKQRVRTKPDLKEHEVEEAVPEYLNKKDILSQLMGIFDKAGLVLPFKMKGAIHFRKVWQLTKKPGEKLVDWDGFVGNDLKAESVSFFVEMTRLEKVKFPRGLTPTIRFDGVNASPTLVTFSDGSDSAYGACAYVRWRVNNNEAGEECYEIRLAESRGKLCPLDMKGDTVKSELCGSVFASRLKGFVTLHAKMKFGGFYHFLDSMTVLGAIAKDSYGFQTFTANRVGEVQEGTNPDDWAWIPTKDNPSDLITRGASPEQLGKGSFWQVGPEWLAKAEKYWPWEKKVPQEAEREVVLLQRKAFTQVATRDESTPDSSEFLPVASRAESTPDSPELWAVKNLIVIKKYSDWNRLLRVVSACVKLLTSWKQKTTPILGGQEWRSRLGYDNGGRWLPRSISQMEAAKNAVLIHSQKEVKISQMDKLVAYRNDYGVLVTSGRFGSDVEFEFTVPILPNNCHAAKLLTMEAHQKNHDGIDGTMTRLREMAWIFQVRKTVKSAVYSCVKCRKDRAEKLCQIMGELPVFRARPSPAFMFTTVDHFGPLMIKGEVNKRTRMKVWGCVFSCLASRAIYTDICYDQSTEAFLTTYRRFQTIHGAPAVVYSDPGSNYVGAEAELKRFVEGLDTEQLADYGVHVKTEWRFHAPDAPHANGAAEATVKIIKKALKNAIGDSVVSFSDLQTVFFEASEVANERPTGLKFSEDQKINYLCPNQLLLGRVGPVIPAGPWEFSKKPLRRFKEVQSIVDCFWKQWVALSFPKLVERAKWHTERRNLRKNDIVLIADEGFRSKYKLAAVVNPIEDKAGRVRKADLFYKNIGPEPTKLPAKIYKKGNKGEKVTRDVRKIVLILPVEEQEGAGFFADEEEDLKKADGALEKTVGPEKNDDQPEKKTEKLQEA